MGYKFNLELNNSTVFKENGSKGTIKMNVLPKQTMTSKEKLSKALEDIRDVVNAAGVNVETVVKEYDKFATVCDQVSNVRNLL